MAAAGIPADVRPRSIAGYLRAAHPAHRLRVGRRHAVRQHGQPDGTELCQRHDRGRQPVGIVRHGLPSLHVPAGNYHSGDADDFSVTSGLAGTSGSGL